MKFEVRTPSGLDSRRTPGSIFKKWVIIGALVGAVLVGIAGMLLVGAVMVGGALVGAIAGAIVGVVKAAIAIVRGN